MIKNKKRNKTTLYLPFKGSWFVFWGGDTKKLNAHHNVPNQKFAFDLDAIDKNGKRYKRRGKKNEDYYSFGKKILAPADGVVVEFVDGIRDNKPGLMNDYFIFGNTIIIKHRKNEISVLAHLRQGSLKVKAGDKVKKGQIIALCGNSGNSSEPHLHYHLQDNEIIQKGKGIKIFFKDVKLFAKGKEIFYKEYSPRKKDCIKATSKSDFDVI